MPMFRMPDDFVEKFDALIDARRVKHPAAKSGSTVLKAMKSADKFDVFVALMQRTMSADAIAVLVSKRVRKMAEAKKNLVPALRRLSVVGVKLFEEVAAGSRVPSKKALQEGQDAELEVYDLSFKPGVSLQEHIRAAALAPKDYDCVAKMASLSSVLEMQMKSLYTHPTRSQNPFMMVRDVNMVTQTYMSALEKLHRMQLDVGIVEKSPEKMEVTLAQSEAFQSYIGELSRDNKQAMINFADKFCKFVKDMPYLFVKSSVALNLS